MLSWVATIMLVLPPIAVLVVIRRCRILDRAFAAWDLDATQAGVVIRGWAGEINGRTFNAWFSKGPTLELYLSADSHTRGGIVWKGGLARFAASIAKITPVDLDGALVGRQIHGEDNAWMSGLVADDGVAQAIGRLTGDDGQSNRMLLVAPDAVCVRMRFLPMSAINADNLQQWVSDLEAVAQAVDARPDPAEKKTTTKLEQRLRTYRGKVWMLGCVAVVTVVVVVAIGGLIALLVQLG